MKSNDPTNRKFTFIFETLNAVLITASVIFFVVAINKMNLNKQFKSISLETNKRTYKKTGVHFMRII